MDSHNKIQNKEEAKDYLKKNWASNLSDISYIGIQRLYKYFNGILSLSEIEDTLSRLETYSLMKSRRPNKRLGMFFSFHKFEVVQIDSFQLPQDLIEHNNGFRHVLSLVDIFTKKAFCQPLRDRTSKGGLEALKIMFYGAGQYPDILQSDAGGECSSREIQEYLKTIGCKAIVLRGEHKGSIVEAFQRTIQKKIASQMDREQTMNWVDALPELVASYNLQKHTFTDFTPFEAFEDSRIQEQILEKFAAKYNELHLKKKMRKNKKIKFQLGDIVRIHIKKNAFTRSFHQQSNPQRYIINRIITSKLHPQYELKDEDGKIVKNGLFMANDMVRVNLGQIYRQYVRSSFIKNGVKYNRIAIPGYPEKDDTIVQAAVEKE